MATITQGGITVTISGSPTTGAWRVNGHYIVGACTITGWTPTPTGSGATRRHGAMLNPASLTQQGFDGRMDNSGYEQEYSAALDASLSLPISLSPGDCLVVAASGNLSSADLDAEGGNAQMLDEIMVIHCVTSAPASTDFRPPYAGTDRTVFSTSDIVGTLPNHAAPFDPIGSGVFDFNMDSDPQWLQDVQWFLDMEAERPANRMPPRAQQQYYPAYRSKFITALAALSITDHARKIEARDRVIQVGIDIWGCIKATMSGGRNGIFSSGAGYGNGYYFPLMYAGYMLGNAEMLSYLDLKWTNHGGYWHYDSDFDVDHPWQDGDGNPIDYTGEIVGCFWETTSIYNSATAWAGYNLPRSREDYTEGIPLYGDARNVATEGGPPGTNDVRKHIAKVYHGNACDLTGYSTPLTAASGWGDYMMLAMQCHAGSFIVARLMGIEGYYPNAAREMAYWWLSDNDLWRTSVVGNAALEDIYAYGGTGNTFLRSLWASHGSMGAYIADGAPPDPDPLPAVQTATLTISVTV